MFLKIKFALCVLALRLNRSITVIIGPFSVLEFDSIQHLLESEHIDYEVVISEKGLSALRDNRNCGGRFFHLGPAVIKFEISDKDFKKIKSFLEARGFDFNKSDGKFELS